VHHNITIDAEILSKLVGYMKTPQANIGFKNDLIAIFSQTVSITAQNSELNGLEELSYEEYPTWISSENIIDKLGKIGIARACCYRFPNSHNTSLLFRPLNSDVIYRLTLTRHQPKGKITIVNIEPWADNRVSAQDMQRLKKRVPKETIAIASN
jgi:hypothetical protein